MNITNPENSKQPARPMGQITRQRGFFSIGLSLGLSAIFALFGTTLAPEEEVNKASNQMEVQAMANNYHSLLMHPETYPAKHQF